MLRKHNPASYQVISLQTSKRGRQARRGRHYRKLRSHVEMLRFITKFVLKYVKYYLPKHHPISKHFIYAFIFQLQQIDSQVQMFRFIIKFVLKLFKSGFPKHPPTSKHAFIQNMYLFMHEIMQVELPSGHVQFYNKDCIECVNYILQKYNHTSRHECIQTFSLRHYFD